jgi:hypothetical protein
MKIYIIFELFYRSHLSQLYFRFRRAREYIALGRILTSCRYSISENNPTFPREGRTMPAKNYLGSLYLTFIEKSVFIASIKKSIAVHYKKNNYERDRHAIRTKDKECPYACPVGNDYLSLTHLSDFLNYTDYLLTRLQEMPYWCRDPPAWPCARSPCLQAG